jgi:hypothetical protein
LWTGLSRRLPLLAALGILATVAWLLPVRDLDLAVYWRASQQVFVAGTEPYTQTVDTGLPFTYPPTALFLLRPLAGLSLQQAANVLWVFNLALAVAVLLLLPRDLATTHAGAGCPAPSAADIARRRLRVWGPLYIACFGGVYLTLHFQQVNLLLLLCVWGFWRTLRRIAPGSAPDARPSGSTRALRDWLALVGGGAALALGSVAKPHYGLLVLGAGGCMWSGNRPGPGLRLLLGTALGGATLLWLSLVVAPHGSWTAWWAQVPGTTSFTALPPGHSSIAAPWNRSLAGEVARWLVPNKFIEPVAANPVAAGYITAALVFALGVATARAVLGSLALRARRCAAGVSGVEAVAVDLELSLIAVWVFLAAPASWTHHLVMLLPAALVLLRDAVLDPRAGGLGRLAAVLVLAVLALTLDDLVPREVRTSSRAILVLMTLGVVGLWALLLERLLRLTKAKRVRCR